MKNRPAFVQVPTPDGHGLTAVVANRQGIAPVDLNGVEHVGLLLSVNKASSTIAVLTEQEAIRLAGDLVSAATNTQRVNILRAAAKHQPKGEDG